jgi:hypothetical protein
MRRSSLLLAAIALATVTSPVRGDEPMTEHSHMHHHGGGAAPPSNAEHWDFMTSPDRCPPEQYWSFAMSMCLWRPSELGHFGVMLMGAIFLTDVGVSGIRSAHAVAAPNWLMADAGVDLARWNRLELDAMFTVERWTYPDAGYPLPFQIGEANEHGVPFIDAQHPHSSPLMGLQLTDVMSLSSTKTRILRVWFAPRGESTDGPIAFMHRPTGTVNPDAPLGHHIGQDVGHISSTVIGVSLTLQRTIVEASTFYGHEPSPDIVDLPLGVPDSAALRVSQQLGPHYTVAISGAYVASPEAPDHTGPVARVSASGYGRWDLPRGWRAHGTVIWGGIANYDGVGFLNSLTTEVLFTDWNNAIWGRIEALQRTPLELGVMTTPQLANLPDWVGAVTLGYTRKIVSLGPFDFDVGASGTLNFMTDIFLPAYGGRPILSGKLFVEARLIQMWNQ